MSQNETVERKYGDYVPKELNLQCIRCDKTLRCDGMSVANAKRFPCVSGGVVFRSSGQYGSRTLDCGVGIPRGYESEVQIILCDECVEAQGHRINMWTEPRPVLEMVANYGGDTRERLTEWSDYTTYAEVDKIAKAGTLGSQPLGIYAELEDAEKAGNLEKVEEIKAGLEDLHKDLTKWVEDYDAKTQEQKDAEEKEAEIAHKEMRAAYKEEHARLLKLYGPKEML